MSYVEIIKNIYKQIKKEIVKRIEEFKNIGRKGDSDKIFAELIFCILTPQSKAVYCWEAVKNLENKKLLEKGDKTKIMNELKKVRFKHKKTEYIIEIQKKFSHNNIKEILSQYPDVYEKREWLVKNIKGMGYKEASHFLRNIGFCDNIAILDRHILKNLKLLGVISEIPSSLSGKKYFLIEKQMINFSKKINIPVSHLDLLLWYKETGKIFK